MGRKKKERTKLLENTVRTNIVGQMIAEEIQQMKFDRLVIQGIIRIDADADTETIDRRLPNDVCHSSRKACV